MSKAKTGIYLIGARGQVASTVIAGLLGLTKGLIPPRGLITTTKPFDNLSLLPWSSFIVGGTDISTISLTDNLNSVLRPCGLWEVADKILDEIESVEENIDPGTAIGCGDAVQGLAKKDFASLGLISLDNVVLGLREKIRGFRDRNRVGRVIVVNVASTEPPLDLNHAHANLESFEDAIEQDERDLVRASTLYTYASLKEGCAYINFTPSNAALTPALIQLAKKEKLPVMGNDGKTGETLMKSALAPMFNIRNLNVLSWQGYNMLGNMDGQVLSHKDNKSSKLQSKDRSLSKILGYNPHSQVGIDYVPSLGDQKTAWDFIHFEGFMGAKMSVQVTWQGFDSILAAPLVLDMVRLTDLALKREESGPMKHMACFFKDPLEVREHGLVEQYDLLLKYVKAVSSKKKFGDKIVPFLYDKGSR